MARYNVHRSTTSGFTPSAANRIAQPTGTSYTDTGLAATTYYYKVTAEDPTGNVGPVSNEASAVVTNPPPVGLVAGYGFDEGTGTTAADSSGRGNTGTLANGTTWAFGRFGTAASFDGVNDWVTAADAASLDLTTGMTLEAWVMPTVNTGWRSVVFKEGSSDLVYGMYMSTDTNFPTGEAQIGATIRYGEGPDHGAREHLVTPHGDLRRHHPADLPERRPRGLAGGVGQHLRPRPARCGSAATTSSRSTSPAASTRCASTTAR